MYTEKEIESIKQEIESIKAQKRELENKESELVGNLMRDYLDKTKKRFADSVGRSLERGDKVRVSTNDYYDRLVNEELYFMQFYIPSSYCIDSAYIYVEFAKIKKDGGISARFVRLSSKNISKIELVK